MKVLQYLKLHFRLFGREGDRGWRQRPFSGSPETTTSMTEVQLDTTEHSSTTATTSTYDPAFEPVIRLDPLHQLPKPNEPCPYNSSDLVGLRKPTMAFKPSWREIESLMAALNVKDGCSQPTDCIPTERLAVIIPYKDREEHLVKWLWHMHQILGKRSCSRSRLSTLNFF